MTCLNIKHSAHKQQKSYLYLNDCLCTNKVHSFKFEKFSTELNGKLVWSSVNGLYTINLFLNPNNLMLSFMCLVNFGIFPTTGLADSGFILSLLFHPWPENQITLHDFVVWNAKLVVICYSPETKTETYEVIFIHFGHVHS